LVAFWGRIISPRDLSALLGLSPLFFAMIRSLHLPPRTFHPTEFRIDLTCLQVTQALMSCPAVRFWAKRDCREKRSPEYVWFFAAPGETWKVNIIPISSIPSSDVCPLFLSTFCTWCVMMTGEAF
jgi:hypothetical protein